MYYIYILRCSDNSLYTGITTDISRRISEHTSQNNKSAKYTKSHAVTGIEALWETENRVDASRLEYRIKQLKKPQKEELIISKKPLTKMIDGVDDVFKRLTKTQMKKLGIL